MDIKEYTKQNLQINESIKALQDQKKRLKSEYIKTCSEFSRGEKVEVSFKNGTKKEAFIGNISIGFKNNLLYDFYKVKNDGTVSQHQYHFYIYESVKSLDK